MTQIERISGHTHLIALIGNPTSHSLSPATHNQAFGKAGVDAIYLCFDVQKLEDLPAVFAAMKAMDGWDGCNVTMPYKQAVIPLLDEMDEAAELMGAVNVVRCRDGKTKGFNSDGAGFWRNVRKSGVELEGKRLSLIGCGGAGSAIFVQAAFEGIGEIDVFELEGTRGWRNASEIAPKLTERTGCKVDRHAIGDEDALAASLAACDILVNSTPVGMGEGSTDTPVSAALLSSNMRSITPRRRS